MNNIYDKKIKASLDAKDMKNADKKYDDYCSKVDKKWKEIVKK